MEEVKLLILTVLFELPLALLFLRKEEWQRVVLVVLGVNMISHPIVWQMLYSWDMNWFLAEACVAAFEGLIYGLIFKDRQKLALFTGVFINIVTAAIGYIFF